ncbi:hypothetical protein Peur_019794 [Populus x canadensis]
MQSCLDGVAALFGQTSSARADVAAPANVFTEDNHNQEQDSPGSVEDGEILIVFPCRGTVTLHGGCVGLLGIQIGAEFDCVGFPGTVTLRRQHGNSATVIQGNLAPKLPVRSKPYLTAQSSALRALQVPIPAANPATNLPAESPHKPR